MHCVNLEKQKGIHNGKNQCVDNKKNNNNLHVLFSSGSWKEKTFKPYNFEALGVAPDCGHLHPLMKVRTQFRQIFLEMG